MRKVSEKSKILFHKCKVCVFQSHKNICFEAIQNGHQIFSG